MRCFARLLACAAVAGTAALLPGGAAAAPSGSVAGTVTTKPAKGADGAVVATNLATGSVASVTALSKQGAFKVTLPPGGYTLSTQLIPPPGGGAVSTSRLPVTLKAGQKRSKVKVKTKKRTAGGKHAAAASARATRAYTQENGQVTPGVTAFSVEDFTGAPPTGEWQFMNQAMADLLITDLVGKTPCPTAVVANKRDRKLIEQELDLQKSTYVDPKTRVKRNFIKSDLTVSGTISVAPDQSSAQVTVNITDARSGKVLDSFTTTLPQEGFFEAEEQLAKEIAKRVCRRPAAYELSLSVNGQGNFATHTASGTIENAKLTALRSGGALGGQPTSWSGIASFSWTGVAGVSKTDCSYTPDPHQGTWAASLTVVGETDVKVDWNAGGSGAASLTVTCPSDNGPVVIPGQPGPALINIAPLSATVPLTGGSIPLSGGFTSGSDGWTNSGQILVKPIWD